MHAIRTQIISSRLRLADLFFERTWAVAAFTATLLILIAGLPNLGLILAFGFLALALLASRGGLGLLGFRRPESWRRTLLLGCSVGVVFQLGISVGLDAVFGSSDLSNLDGMRGNAAATGVMLVIVWVIGGFAEEMLFRGYLLNRLEHLLGSRRIATGFAVVLPALAFGMAHVWQGPSGMIGNFVFGVILGASFVVGGRNLWVPVIAHGVSNTIGILLIATNLDLVLGRFLP